MRRWRRGRLKGKGCGRDKFGEEERKKEKVVGGD